MTAKDRQLLSEVRDLLREAMPFLRCAPPEPKEKVGQLATNTEIVQILAMDDPVAGLRERNKSHQPKRRKRGG